MAKGRWFLQIKVNNSELLDIDLKIKGECSEEKARTKCCERLTSIIQGKEKISALAGVDVKSISTEPPKMIFKVKDIIVFMRVLHCT